MVPAGLYYSESDFNEGQTTLTLKLLGIYGKQHLL